MLWFGCGDGPGHLGSEVAFHRCSRSRSSMSNFSAPSSPTFPLLCFISFPECGFSSVAILTLVWNSADRKRLVGQLFPSILELPLSGLVGLQAGDRPGPCSTKVSSTAGAPADARTERPDTASNRRTPATEFRTQDFTQKF